DAILALVNDVENNWNKKLVTSALFLDVKGAFDNVSCVCLLQTMQQMRILTPLVHWVEHFITERSIQLVFYGQQEELVPVETGIPQGSPVSPVLFLIYLKPLFDTLEKKHPNLQFPSYIDDVAVIATGRTLAVNVKELDSAARTVFQWAERNEVAFD